MDLEDDALTLEQDSEACWSLWQELADGMAGLAPPRPHPVPKHEAEPAKRAYTASAALEVALQNQRVCPMPGAWLQLHDILTLGGRRRLEPQPPSPLVGRAWVGASLAAKRARLQEFVLWARDYGGLRALHEFLEALDEAEWLHGEPMSEPKTTLAASV